MKNTIYMRAFCIVLLGMIVFCAGCDSGKIATRSDFVLDTIVTMTAYGVDDESIFAPYFDQIRTLDKQLDAFSSESEIGQINSAAGIKPVTVSQGTYDLIQESLYYSKLSHGAFDITVGPLVDLWEIGEPETKDPPSKDEIDKAKAKVDYKKIVLNPADRSVYLPEKGMEINLGAIAKGYIGDIVKKSVQDAGLSHMIINLGGNVVLIAGKSKNEEFTVAVENPEDTNGSPIGVITIKDCSIVTSGDYQRYFIDSKGRRYHHILDVNTGYPSEQDLHQVTVVCSSSTKADSLSTCLFLMGSEEAMKYINSDDEIEGILVTTDNDIMVSKGLKEKFRFDNKQEKKYTLKVYE